MSNITMSAEQLQTLIAQAVATALSAQPVKAVSSEGKTDRQAKTDIAIVRAFKKAGYKDSQIRLIDRLDPSSEKSATILTYNRWIAQGRKVKTGEHSVKVKNLRFFHKDQTVALTEAEKAEEMARMAEAIAKYQAKNGMGDNASA